MYTLRFKVQCLPGKDDDLKAAFQAVVAPSRRIEGVLGFDVAQDVTDSTRFVAVEVFEDESAQERQEALPEVAGVMALLPTVLAGPPEVTVFHVERAEVVAM